MTRDDALAREPSARPARALTGEGHAAKRPSARTVVTIGSVIAAGFMGSVIVTPLYSLYREEFGFSEFTLTLIYATYVLGNIGALLFAGQISDQLGRKRVVFPALALAALSAALFLLATGTAWLFAARFLIGLAAGTLSGVGTAWMAESFGPGHGSLPTVCAATANLTGIALGPLLAGALAQYTGAPLVLPLVAFLVILAVIALGIRGTSDARRPTASRVRELRIEPRVGVPAAQLRAFAAPAIAGFATFSVGGLYFALIPSIVAEDLGVSNLAVGGSVVFELGALAAALIVLGRRVPPRRAMSAGLLSLIPAVALIVGAEATESLGLLLAATALGAVSLSLGYRGSLQVVNEIAPDERRGEVVSSFFISCFLGNAVPVIGVGILSTLTDRLLASAAFAVTIAALAIAALAWSSKALRPSAA